MVTGLRIQNSPQFHMKFDGCQGVLIDKLSISSPKLSPNTDGIHIENTKSVGIYNSVIANGISRKTQNLKLYEFEYTFFSFAKKGLIDETGDDCISIGTGCSDVDIEAVTCGPSHGIRYVVFLLPSCNSLNFGERDQICRL